MSDQRNTDDNTETREEAATDGNQFEINDEKCQQLVEQFALYTSTDEALAQFYLQDRNWNLQTSLNDYFDDVNSESNNFDNFEPKKRKLGNKSESDDEISVLSVKPSASQSSSDLSIKKETESHETPEQLKQLFFVTWNIDGLNEKNIRIRTEAVCNIIKSENAAIVFLQEVIALSEEILRENLPQYVLCTANQSTVEYYCVTLLRKDCVQLVSIEIIDFDNTSMGRNMLKVNALIGGTKLCLLNTHLESTKEFAVTRMAQLAKAFKLMKAVPNDETVILAGDLNLRDTELSSIGGLPNGISDVWEATGSRKECEFTWDQTRNDNLPALGGSKWKPRCRFDRVLLRESSTRKLSAAHFGLIGLQRLKPHVCFPSDHWGILCYFDIM